MNEVYQKHGLPYFKGDNNAHRFANDPESLKELLTKAGFSNINYWFTASNMIYENGKDLFDFFSKLPNCKDI